MSLVMNRPPMPVPAMHPIPSVPAATPAAAPVDTLAWLTELLRLAQGEHGEPQAVLQAMLDHAVAGSGGTRGCLAMADPERPGLLRVAAATGLPLVHGQEVAVGSGPLAGVLARGTPWLGTANPLLDAAGLPEPEGRVSSVCWPLVPMEACIGVVVVDRAGGERPFTAADLDFARPVATLFALVTDNWRMHEDLRERLRRLEAVNEENRAVTRRLAEAHSQLLQSEKLASIGQLAAGVAHEINNPVGYVSSNLKTLERYIGQLFAAIDGRAQPGATLPDAEELEFLRQDVNDLVAESAQGLKRVICIVSDLKNFSRVDQVEAWDDADLLACLDSTLNIVNNEVKYKAVVDRRLTPLPPVPCIASQINQVMLNLLVNAAQAIERDGRITLRSGVDEAAGEVWLEIEDNGCGIAPEHMNRLFEPFFTTKPVGQGTGLGLSLSYSIMRKHGGRLEVRSQRGVGTTFRMVLPARKALVAPAA
jgi:signal transduction histidine kinase